jgi:hypothetical protein
MSGEVPPILWYLLAFFSLVVFPLSMLAAIHRHRMKALEILRFYAEKDTEAPPHIAELLAKQLSDTPGEQWRSTARGSRLNTFGIHVFVACILGCIAWWRIDSGGPPWTIYWMVGAATFFGLLGLGFLAAALVSSDK